VALKILGNVAQHCGDVHRARLSDPDEQMPFVDWVAMGQKFRRFPAGDAVEQVIQVTREQGRRFGIGEAAGDLPLELERAGFAEPDVGVLNADLKEHLSDYIWHWRANRS